MESIWPTYLLRELRALAYASQKNELNISDGLSEDWSIIDISKAKMGQSRVRAVWGFQYHVRKMLFDRCV